MFEKYANSLSLHSIFGHKTVNKLFPKIIRQLGVNYGKPIPESSEDNAQAQSIYHFFFQPSC